MEFPSGQLLTGCIRTYTRVYIYIFIDDMYITIYIHDLCMICVRFVHALRMIYIRYIYIYVH